MLKQVITSKQLRYAASLVTIASMSAACGIKSHAPLAGAAAAAAHNRSSRNALKLQTTAVTAKAGDTEACGDRHFSEVFTGRALTKDELEKVTLPYISNSEHQIPTLQLGDSTHTSPNGLPYVKNSNVVFAFDVSVPKKETLTKINPIQMTSGLTEVTQDKYSKTDELICLAEQKTCSGEIYRVSNWQANINPAFWGQTKEADNDFFTRQLIAHDVEDIGHEQLSYSDSLTISFQDLFPKVDPKSVIYSSEPVVASADPTTDDGLSKKTVVMIVSDHTYVSRPELKVELDWNPCQADHAHAADPVKP